MSPAADFPVICIGGSAGGLDAYKALLQTMPADTGAAIIIVNHLRHVVTMLPEILPNYTSMKVTLISEGLRIQPNHVFIIPEKADLHVRNNKFHLTPISKPRGWPNVITIFLCSLAQEWKGRIIAVIVSGYDGDGAEALRSIKDAGGITIAQKQDTAAHPDMPTTAIDTGYIDYILAPRDIARKIVEIIKG